MSEELTRTVDVKKAPELYRVGRGEEGVFGFEPYKSEMLPLWRFATPELARDSSKSIYALFLKYENEQDFIGMDMARKYLQMGYTRSMRYARHKGGRKFDGTGRALPETINQNKLESAAIFKAAWQDAEENQTYADMKMHWRAAFG